MSNMIKRIKAIDKREINKKSINDFFLIYAISFIMFTIGKILFYFIHGV